MGFLLKVPFGLDAGSADQRTALALSAHAAAATKGGRQRLGCGEDR
jgi:hypothetical protein